MLQIVVHLSKLGVGVSQIPTATLVSHFSNISTIEKCAKKIILTLAQKS
jgi:hypothetical protein